MLLCGSNPAGNQAPHNYSLTAPEAGWERIRGVEMRKLMGGRLFDGEGKSHAHRQSKTRKYFTSSCRQAGVQPSQDSRALSCIMVILGTLPL